MTPGTAYGTKMLMREVPAEPGREIVEQQREDEREDHRHRHGDEGVDDHPAEALEEVAVRERADVVVETDEDLGGDAQAGAADPAALETQPERVEQGCDQQAEREQHGGCDEDPGGAPRLE